MRSRLYCGFYVLEKTRANRRGLSILLLLGILGGLPASAQTPVNAYNVPPGVVGNTAAAGVGLGGDFRVLRPIVITHLGVFDSRTNGIQGSTVLTVQLFEKNGNAGALLETLSFDAANPGSLRGGNRFKPLTVPVTLLPGAYSVVAYGFNADSVEQEGNPAADASLAPYTTRTPAWTTMNDGGGLIRFEGNRGGNASASAFPTDVDNSPVNRYAAGTFAYSAATLPDPPYTADYAALVSGIQNLPLEDERHLGSLAILGECAFPLLVEQGGNRLAVAAASTCDTNGARVVAFTHVQWGESLSDGRMTLFENAIKWAARKSNPADIVIGLGTRLPTNYFQARGYIVRPFDPWMQDPTNQLPECDVVVASWNTNYANRVLNRIQRHVAQGKGVVVTTIPQLLIYPSERSAFPRLNTLLQPFGLAYRSSLTRVADFGFTNVPATPPPVYFSAFQAAGLLYQDRLGLARLGSLEKAIALNTITYASHGRPELLGQLRAIYAGTTNSAAELPIGNVGQFADVVTLNGAQATTNRLGRWVVRGSDLVAADRRGAVEYEFNLPYGNLFRLQLEGTQNWTNSPRNEFDLILSVDGQSLGHHLLKAAYGTNGAVSCFTPFLLAGHHTLRVYWDNAASFTSLRLQRVRVQAGAGPDADGNGLQDWVEQFVHAQSGLDITNDLIDSYVSPACLEGRDPYPSLLEIGVLGADDQTARLNPRPAPNGRWYVNVPLSAYVNAQTALRVTYQNGGRSESRHLHWQQLNLIHPGSLTNLVVRQGDALLLNALPEGSLPGYLTVAAGGQQSTGHTRQPLEWRFTNAGTYTVTGTYTPTNGPPQSGSIRVRVVRHAFPNNPDSMVGRARTWELPTVAPEAVLEADARLFFEQTASLPGNGRQMSLLTDQNEPRSIISRLGTNGVILDSARVNGVRMVSSPETYNTVLQTYPDGSRLMEVLMVLHPVLPDIKVEARVIVGGVTFDDGTTYRELLPADFDALGRYKLRFIKPASVRTANCRRITILQGTTVVGVY